MSLLFEELDYRPTPLGALSLRRRRDPARGVDIYEIKLGDEFLMTSLFNASEIALARLGLEPLAGCKDLDVIVGGLGLGYTAEAALAAAGVRALTVVEALDPVIDWHEKGILPLGDVLAKDPRCRFQHGDFFELAAAAPGAFDLQGAAAADAVLLDIDHAPDNLLSPSHAGFYTVEGLSRLAAHIKPGGVFALWSNDPPEEAFRARLAAVFEAVEAQVVRFENALQDGEAACTVYVARKKTAL